jgi:hypothetical protein
MVHDSETAHLAPPARPLFLSLVPSDPNAFNPAIPPELRCLCCSSILRFCPEPPSRRTVVATVASSPTRSTSSMSGSAMLLHFTDGNRNDLDLCLPTKSLRTSTVRILFSQPDPRTQIYGSIETTAEQHFKLSPLLWNRSMCYDA